MSNTPSKVNLADTYATFLTQAAGTGTWADVLDTLKQDEAGFEADADQIDEASGELWGNVLDDFVKAVWELAEGSNRQSVHTSGTGSQPVTVMSLTANGDYKNIGITVKGHAQADNELAVQTHTVFAYRTGGTVTLWINSSPGMTQLNLAGVTSVVSVSGDNVIVTVTGIAAKEIDWVIENGAVRNLPPAP
jgi:hypothetical protein